MPGMSAHPGMPFEGFGPGFAGTMHGSVAGMELATLTPQLGAYFGTDKGVLVRTRVSEIREMGRATQGVTLMSLDDGSKLSGLQRIVENDAAVDAEAEGDADTDGAAKEGTEGTPE